MKKSIPHSLDVEKAKLVVKKAIEAYQERFAKYDFSPTWVGDDRVDFGFSVKGKRLEGSMSVQPRSLDFELDVPFIFRAFSVKATAIIEDEVQRWVGKAQRGEI